MISKTKDIEVTDMYKPDPRTFGGMIYEYDFDGRTYMQDVAAKIISNWKFDDMYSKIAKRLAKTTGNI